jgi:hypothetical protein
VIVICIAIAVLAIGARLLMWQDNRPLFPQVFIWMVRHHQENARGLLRGEVTRFITGPSPPGDANILTYPPGYPILMAIVFRLFADEDSSMRLFQVLCDAAAAVLLFFVASQFLPRSAAFIAGVLAALSPQLSYYSLLLLPDSLATLPILAALYFVIRAIKTSSLGAMIASGVCVGLSCWLRSNALLLAPFLGVVVFLLMKKVPGTLSTRGSLRRALALVAAALIVIAPITIRNVVVFHRFVPLSLGAGQMLNVGIGEYDREHRFGLPRTDLETVTSEATKYNQPDYVKSLFGVNGIERDQRRFSEGLTVIREHPLWFGSVLVKRGVSMFKLERVAPVSAQPAPSHSINNLENRGSTLIKAPRDLIDEKSNSITFAPASSADAVQFEAPADRSDTTILIAPMTVERDNDYVVRVPIRLDEGNLVASVRSASGSVLSTSPVLRPIEKSAIILPPVLMVEIPFINRDSSSVELVLQNDSKRPVRTTGQIGRMELLKLGTASLVWLRYPRVLIHLVQGFFITAWILPFACLGIFLMWWAGKGRYLLILMAIPLYYICVQSFLHTEYRYVMAIQYSLFLFVAASLYWLGAYFASLRLRVFAGNSSR